MKIFFIWLLMMRGEHQGIVTAFLKESDCRVTAAELNARVGDNRGLHWTCEKQGVER
jgi:hypothetical protein